MRERSKILNSSIFRSIVVLVVLLVLLTILSPNFLSFDNLMNVLRQVSINGMIAAGLTLVILTGGIDLSVGSILAFSGAAMASILQLDLPLGISLIVGLVIGIIFGYINGLLVTRFKIQPFIATLVTMMFLRGSTLVLTGGKPISIPADSVSPIFAFLGRGSILGIPIPTIAMIIVYIIIHFILTQTKYGRHLYAVGGNEKAAQLSGVNTGRVKRIAYTICGVTAFFASIIVTSRLASAQPTAGEGYEMDAIASIVIGGTSMSGGHGNIIGTFIGVLIIGVLNNALNLMNVPSYYQSIVKAIIILLAVLSDRKKASN